MAEGEGTRAERARRRRVWKSYGVFALAAAAIDAMVFMVAHPPGGPGQPIMPPLFAALAALLFAALLNVGVWWQLRQGDELSYRNNLEAFTIGSLFTTTAYFSWWFLWLGGVLPKPDGFPVIVAGSLVAGLALASLKWMRR
jgi:hypothetical protein